MSFYESETSIIKQLDNKSTITGFVKDTFPIWKCEPCMLDSNPLRISNGKYVRSQLENYAVDTVEVDLIETQKYGKLNLIPGVHRYAQVLWVRSKSRGEARMQKFINFLSPLPTMWKNYDTKVFDGPNLARSNLVFRICASFIVVKI